MFQVHISFWVKAPGINYLAYLFLAMAVSVLKALPSLLCLKPTKQDPCTYSSHCVHGNQGWVTCSKITASNINTYKLKSSFLIPWPRKLYMKWGSLLWSQTVGPSSSRVCQCSLVWPFKVSGRGSLQSTWTLKHRLSMGSPIYWPVGPHGLHYIQCSLGSGWRSPWGEEIYFLLLQVKPQLSLWGF